MTRSRRILGAAMGLALNAGVPVVVRASDSVTFSSPTGDVVVRRTDGDNNGPLIAGATLPDVIDVSLAHWQPINPSADPYTGSVVSEGSAHVFRMQVRLAGLVNPPGTLGLSGQPYAPAQFGNSPVFGFFELDVDSDRNTGGEQKPAAAFRPLANASRFGGRFESSSGERQAVWGSDLEQDWYDNPQYVRSGADFALVLCGCFPVTVISKSNPLSVAFEAGQTWVVQGRFLQRSGGYIAASAMSGGSVPGAYDAPVNLQFAHDALGDITTITLVYPLDQIGAAQLAGHATQPANSSAADDTSIAEGVSDLISSSGNGAPGSLTKELIRRWQGKDLEDSLDPTRWDLRWIVATAYAQATDGLYVFTDVGPGLLRRDLNGDGVATTPDRTAILQVIAAEDGGSDDEDHTVNGQVVISDYPINFSMFDLDSDGVIGPADLALLPAGCPGDFNGDGSRTVQDIFDFLAAWFAALPTADFNQSGAVTVQDIFDFLAAWFAGCP